MQVPSGLTAAADLVKLEKTLQFVEAFVHGGFREGVDFLDTQGSITVEHEADHPEKPLVVFQVKGFLDRAHIGGFVDGIQKQHSLSFLTGLFHHRRGPFCMRGNECPAVAVSVQDPLPAELFDGFPDGHPADIQPLGNFPFAQDRGLRRLALDVLLQKVHDLDVFGL